MDNKKIIIGLCGKKQCGKDTSYRFICELTDVKVKRFAFADKLKDITANLFGVNRHKLDGSDADKDSPTHLKWFDVAPHIVADFYESSYSQDMTAFITHRELLQLFGTNACRAIAPNIWPECTCRAIKNSDASINVITDVRFPNELMVLKKMGGIVVKIYRQTNSNLASNHSSETALDHIPDAYYDFVIRDSGNRTMGELKQSWKKILKKILKN